MKSSRFSIRRGFTLVEVLVAIAMIAILSVVVLTLSQRIRLSAAKANGISQMREIGVAILSWTSDKGLPEPFYASDGFEDKPDESSPGGEFRPGNPALALYNREHPESGHVHDFNIFFSPLSESKAPSPDPVSYDPAKASENNPWGTYTYHFPHVTADQMSPRHVSLGIEAVPRSNPSINGKLLLTEFYHLQSCPPRYGKQVHHALLSDGSVRFVADDEAAWTRWKDGE